MMWDLEGDFLFYIFDYLSPSNDLSFIAMSSMKMREAVLVYKASYIENFKRRHPLLLNIQLKDHNTVLEVFKRIILTQILIIGDTPGSRQCTKFHTKFGLSRSCSMDIKRDAESTAVFYKGLVIAISGAEGLSISTVEYYDILRNIWLELPSLSNAITSSAAAVHKGKLYLIGGYDRTQSKRIRDILVLNDEFLSSKPPPPSTVFWTKHHMKLFEPRSFHAAVTYRNEIWIVGGFTSNRIQPDRTVELIDPISGIIRPGPPTIHARVRCKLLVVNNELYAIGGDGNGYAFDDSTIEKYDVYTKKWVLVTEFPCVRRRCCVAVYKNLIYVFGGVLKVISKRDYYDTATGKWGSEVRSIEGSHQLSTTTNGIAAATVLPSLPVKCFNERSNHNMTGSIAVSMEYHIN